MVLPLHSVRLRTLVRLCRHAAGIASLAVFPLSAITPDMSTVISHAWFVLRDGASNKADDKRAKAIAATGLMPDNKTAEDLADKALHDESAEVRTEAASALGQMGAFSSRPQLREALKDKELKVVVAAANALYALKDPAAFDVYYALLTGERKSSVGLLQSQLNRIRDRSELEKLVFQTGIGFVPFGGIGYEAWKTITHDASIPIKAAAAEKLANDPDPKSGQALVKACSDGKWQLRLAILKAIGKRGDPALIRPVVPLIDDDNTSVKYAAAATVLHLYYQPKSRFDAEAAWRGTKKSNRKGGQ